MADRAVVTGPPSHTPALIRATSGYVNHSPGSPSPLPSPKTASLNDKEDEEELSDASPVVPRAQPLSTNAYSALSSTPSQPAPALPSTANASAPNGVPYDHELPPLPLPAESSSKALRPNSYIYDLSQLHVAPRDQVELPPEEAVNPCDYIQDQSRNWNEEFQRLLEKPAPTPEEADERAIALQTLAQDFVTSALPIAEVIIRERHLPDTQKTIVPTNVGGIAGGSKYLTNNLFLKFPKDTQGIYGGDEWAQKTAGHELKSLSAVISCHIDNLHAPLMCLINYRGFRVIVQSILPIDSRTLIYGSSDGGHTVHDSDGKFNEIVQRIALHWQLKPHFVARSGKKLLYGPADLEGHMGKDGRYYILDTARLFPPHPPVEGVSGCWLYRLFRGEFVKSYSRPLSSDAFSGFQAECAAEHNKEVIEAHAKLRDIVIPQFAEYLNRTYYDLPDDSIFPLVEDLHAQGNIAEPFSVLIDAGINLRHLGLVRQHCNAPRVRVLLLTEIFARSASKLLQAKMRKASSSTVYEQFVIGHLNKLLSGGSAISIAYWKGKLKRAVQQRFEYALTEEEAAAEFDPRPRIDVCVFFQRLAQMNGLRFGDELTYRLSTNHADFFKRQITIRPTDHFSLVPTTKVIQLVPLEDGVRSTGRFQALAENRTVSQSRVLLYNEVEKVYKDELAIREKALGRDHMSMIAICHYLAQLYSSQGRYQDAKEYYERLLQIIKLHRGLNHRETAHCLAMVGSFYMQFGKASNAEPLLWQALAIHESENSASEMVSVLERLAKLKRDQGFYQEALRHGLRALDLAKATQGDSSSGNITLMCNIAATYLALGKYRDAEEIQTKALSIAEQFATICYKQERYQQAEKLYKQSLAILEKALGKDHPKRALALHDLAYLYSHMGRYAEAHNLYKDALTILEKNYGTEHPDVAQTRNKLAWIYFKQAKYAEAEKSLTQGLRSSSTFLNASHPEIARSESSLASLLEQRGEYEAAEKLAKHALSVARSTLGEFHEDVARSLNSLGCLYFSKGDYSECEELQKGALQLLEKEFGAENSRLAKVLNDLATGRLSEAEGEYRRALKIQENTLGLQHEETAKIMLQLGYLLSQQGKYKMAAELYNKSLDILTVQFGDAHPEVANNQSFLARLYVSLGRYKEAEAMFSAAQDTHVQRLGPNHPRTARILADMADLYRICGRYREALDFATRALQAQERVLGSSHFDLANTLKIMSQIFLVLGRYAEAEQAQTRGVQIIEYLFGKTHMKLGLGLHQLGILKMKRGLYSEAGVLFDRAQTIVESVLGADHADTAEIARSKAFLLATQAKYLAAEKILRGVRDVLCKALGEEHPRLAETLTTLAFVYTKFARFDEAEKLYTRALELRRASFQSGDLHPDIARNLTELAELYMNVGKYVQAELLAREALTLRKRLFGEQHSDVAKSQTCIANICFLKGDYKATDEALRAAMATVEVIFGKHHHRYTQVQIDLGNLLHKLGEYKAARQLFSSALTTRLALLGSAPHPDVAECYRLLGYSSASAGRYAEAIKDYRTALAINEQVFGQTHLDIAKIESNLAWVQMKCGHIAEAESLYHRARTVREKFFEGRDHPDLARSMHEQGELFLSTGKYELAEQTAAESMQMRERLFGSEHHDVAKSLHLLALIRLRRNDIAGSEAMAARSLAILRTLFGERHAKVAAVLCHFAHLRTAQGRYDEAVDLLQRAAKTYEETFGFHPDLAITLADEAFVLAKSGRTDEARVCVQRASQVIRHSALESDHPDYQRVLSAVKAISDEQPPTSPPVD